MRWCSLVVAACFSPAPPAGAPCASGEACPTGLVCLAGVCTTGGTLDAAVTTDSADGAATFDCWGAWRAGVPTLSAPAMLATLATSQDERDPFLGPDGLSIVFARGPGNGHDIYFASRASRTSPFDNPQPLGTLNTPSDETKLSITGNALTAIFSSNRPGSVGENDLWLATRASPTAAFGNVTEGPLVNLDTTVQEFDPIVSSDGSVLYYSQLDSSVAEQTIQRSKLVGGIYDKPTTVAIKEATPRVADPCPSPDETVLIYTGIDLAGSQTDLYLATKDGDTFVSRGTLPVDTTGNEGDATITADGCNLVYAQQVNGQFDLFEVTVMP